MDSRCCSCFSYGCGDRHGYSSGLERLRVHAGDVHRRGDEILAAARDALRDPDAARADVLDRDRHLELVVEARRLQVIERDRAHDEYDPVIAREFALTDPGRAQPLGARALEET